jgi:hypothetical protein
MISNNTAAHSSNLALVGGSYGLTKPLMAGALCREREDGVLFPVTN